MGTVYVILEIFGDLTCALYSPVLVRPRHRGRTSAWMKTRPDPFMLISSALADHTYAQAVTNARTLKNTHTQIRTQTHIPSWPG